MTKEQKEWNDCCETMYLTSLLKYLDLPELKHALGYAEQLLLELIEKSITAFSYLLRLTTSQSTSSSKLMASD
jgi:hypothetical protein